MSTESAPPCPNCVKLQSELDVANQRLTDGEHSLNIREEHSRAEAADLRRQLADIYAALKVADEGGLVARLQELLAKP